MYSAISIVQEMDSKVAEKLSTAVGIKAENEAHANDIDVLKQAYREVMEEIGCLYTEYRIKCTVLVHKWNQSW